VGSVIVACIGYSWLFFCFKIENRADSYMPREAMAHSKYV
jgi:hypothetical protein